jgi:TetR/AcrR family transcriptional regulator, copper-responsive repressor
MEDAPEVHEAMADFFRDAARILTSQEVPCGCMILAATNVSPERRK